MTAYRYHSSAWIETVLIDEARHRHANEFASALASLHLVKARMGRSDPLIEEAVARLEAGVRLERHLLDCGTPDLHGALLKLCALISVTRPSQPHFQLDIRQRPFIRDAAQMKLILLMAYELLVNAAKHAVTSPEPIGVRLDVQASQLVLIVRNVAAGIPLASPPAGSGTRIVRSLAEQLQGEFVRRRLRGKIHSRLRIPFLLASAAGQPGSEGAGGED